MDMEYRHGQMVLDMKVLVVYLNYFNEIKELFFLYYF